LLVVAPLFVAARPGGWRASKKIIKGHKSTEIDFNVDDEVSQQSWEVFKKEKRPSEQLEGIASNPMFGQAANGLQAQEIDGQEAVDLARFISSDSLESARESIDEFESTTNPMPRLQNQISTETRFRTTTATT
jgi:hypothetical protein